MTAIEKNRLKISVGMSTCNIAAGSRDLFQTLEKSGLDADLSIMGCLGMCHAEPQIRVTAPDGTETLYINVNPAKLNKIIESHLKGGEPVAKWAADPQSADQQQLHGKQRRIVLANCGQINPDSIDDYLARDGYKALEAVLKQNSPEAVIETMIASGLRGRGGAGFPTGLKWKFAPPAASPDQKYVICNADEGDPGAFMDRTTLESDPHAVHRRNGHSGLRHRCLEGYHLLPRRISARHQTPAERYCAGRGKGIPRRQNPRFGLFASNCTFKEGAGAFVCGEETALMGSIEGKRGDAAPRPPFPAQSGLFGKPTTINNVETSPPFRGSSATAQRPMPPSAPKNPKAPRCLRWPEKSNAADSSKCRWASRSREIIEEIGGGTGTTSAVKAVQLGGPSGGCVPAELLDTRIDYDESLKTGAIMGSGGMIVLDETPAWWMSPATSSTLCSSNPAENAPSAASAPNACSKS
jgi:NADH-quinone oxidoreductase subunit F